MDDLVGGLKAGDPAAFESLVRGFGDRLYRFVRRLVGERWADDLTQDVFLRVYRTIASYRPTGRFEAWMYTVANNVCVDFLRRRRPEAPLGEAEQEIEGRSPLERVEEDERRAALMKAVDRLPADQKQVFLLREEAGLSFKEIAAVLGCPLNTALGRMHYAMEQLRKALKTYGMR
ncbi:MAG TPA: sigma-70 family RNA polymerase sigma factor [Planctomycetota bacterium]